MSECARVAGRARERAGVGAGWSGGAGRGRGEGGARAQVSRAEEVRGARSPAAGGRRPRRLLHARLPARRPLAPRLTRPSEEAAALLPRLPRARGIGTRS